MAYAATTEWGTKKRVERVLLSSSCTASGANTVDASAYVPKGTTAITVLMMSNDATVGATSGVRERDASVSLGINTIAVANQTACVTCDVQLDASYTFTVQNSEAFTTVAVYLLAIYA